MFQERRRNVENISLTLDVLTILLGLGFAIVFRVFHESIPLLSVIPVRDYETAIPNWSNYAFLFIVYLFFVVLHLRYSEFYSNAKYVQIRQMVFTYTKATCPGLACSWGQQCSSLKLQ